MGQRKRSENWQQRETESGLWWKRAIKRRADTDDEGNSGIYRLQMVKRIVADTDDEGNSGRYRLQMVKRIVAETDDGGNSGRYR